MKIRAESPSTQRPVLFLSPVTPFAEGTGVEKRAWAHLEALTSLGPVDLVLHVAQPHAQVPELIRQRCRTVSTMLVAPSHNMRKFRIPGLTTLLRLVTYGQPRRKIVDAEAKRNLQEKLKRGNYALFFCFRLSSFSLFTKLLAEEEVRFGKQVVDFDDIESRVLERALAHPDRKHGAEQRLLIRIELAETRRYEMHALRRGTVTVCSTIDASILQRNSADAKILVVPNSLTALSALPPRRSFKSARLLFLGTMTYHPNEDAALYFCHQILPLIRAEVGGDKIELDIVGRGPSARVQGLSRLPGVRVHGGVESVEPAYADSDIVVVPIRYGGGTRIKILEALALGRPVVSTSVGAEGLDLRDREDILIADTPVEFARCCLTLASDEALRSRLAESGRARFMALYESQIVRRSLIQELKKMTSTSNN